MIRKIFMAVLVMAPMVASAQTASASAQGTNAFESSCKTEARKILIKKRKSFKRYLYSVRQDRRQSQTLHVTVQGVDPCPPEAVVCYSFGDTIEAKCVTGKITSYEIR